MSATYPVAPGLRNTLEYYMGTKRSFLHLRGILENAYLSFMIHAQIDEMENHWVATLAEENI